MPTLSTETVNVMGSPPRGLKCLNPKCTYNRLPSYDCTCPACGLDESYAYHYGAFLFYGKDAGKFKEEI